MAITKTQKIAVVIPCYRVSKKILEVVKSLDPALSRIYVVDDQCPEGSGLLVQERIYDSRVKVIFREINGGVGAAVKTGYKMADLEGMDIVVKIDGDGQMDPSLIMKFVDPILRGDADYTKGNRFYNLEDVSSMPKVRLFGNAILSFMTKFSTGYWDCFDPTNGYTAIHMDCIRLLNMDKISNRYFFETDMLFRLGTIRAVVLDVPMKAKYGDETSSLKISKILGEFLIKHFKNTIKRIFYNYYLRDMSIASLELPAGIFLLLFSFIYGSIHWITASMNSTSTPMGTIMLATVTALIGFQLVLAFLSSDMASVPRLPLSRR